jgi:alpha-1,2-mannosyltransferase
MFPAYPLICFNAAVALYLIRGWMEVAYISATKSSYRASRSIIFGAMTCTVIAVTGLISLSRVLALWHYYHAPLSMFSHLEANELPRLLNVTGLLPPLLAGTEEIDRPSIDLAPIRAFDLRLCLGKEWYRFPGHYLVPNGVKVDFVKSEFGGLLPAHFEESHAKLTFKGWWDRPGSRITPASLNDLNNEALEFYVPIESCDYLVDLDFPEHPVSSLLEPRYAVDDETWERVSCHPFLDASHSSLLTRTLWFPGSWWQGKNAFGDYCLLKNREKVHRKEVEVASRVQEGKL